MISETPLYSGKKPGRNEITLLWKFRLGVSAFAAYVVIHRQEARATDSSISLSLVCAGRQQTQTSGSKVRKVHLRGTAVRHQVTASASLCRADPPLHRGHKLFIQTARRLRSLAMAKTVLWA